MPNAITTTAAAPSRGRRKVALMALFTLLLGVFLSALPSLQLQRGPDVGSDVTVAAYDGPVTGVTFADPVAQADTWTCNKSGGRICGKVRNAPYSVASVFIKNHNGATRHLSPGTRSYWYSGFRDVAAYLVPLGYKVHGLGGRCHNGGSWIPVQDNLEDVNARVYRGRC